MDRIQLPKATELLPGYSLLFTTTIPEGPGTRLIDLRTMKDRCKLVVFELI